MLTIFADPTHVLPEEINAPVLRDQLGGGAASFRRRWIRPLSTWELTMPGKHDKLDPIIGLLDYAQGDTPIWFDGAGFAEVVEPIVFGIGDGTQTDYILPHRHVFVSSLVVYNNGGITSAWSPLGGDGVVCDSIRYDSALASGYQATAKYRRRVKCVVQTDPLGNRERAFRNGTSAADSIYQVKVKLVEVAI